MNNDMQFVSTCEIEGAVEIIQDLVALTDPSEYLRDEALLVIDMLRNGEKIPMEDYLILKEQEND